MLNITVGELIKNLKENIILVFRDRDTEGNINEYPLYERIISEVPEWIKSYSIKGIIYLPIGRLEIII